MSHFQDRLAAECSKNAANYDFFLESIDDIRSKIKPIRYEDLALDFSTHAKKVFICRNVFCCTILQIKEKKI